MSFANPTPEPRRRRASYYLGPPNVVDRYWPWPVGFVLFVALSWVEPAPSEFVYFATGAALVALWSELRYSVARRNYADLVRHVIQIEADPERDEG